MIWGMSGNFDWQTDEEFDWDAEPSPKRRLADKRPFRHWRTLIIAAIILLLTGGGLYWNISRRAHQGEQRLRDDLIATQEFITQAGLNQEADLFWTSLSGRDTAWVETMVTLVEQGSYRAYPLLGLGEPEELSPIQATFAPDFSSVNVLQPVRYRITLPNGESQTIELNHFEVYRRGRNGWLLSRNPPSMWGERESETVGRLTVTYPAWDAELSSRLTADLAAQLSAMCQLLALPCEEAFTVTLAFSTDVDSLLILAEPERLLRQQGEFTLPTPTLVGKPTDEAAYRALLRGYASALGTAVLAEQTAYRCCTQFPFFQALVDYQLAELDLRPWPIDDDAYQAAFDNGFSFVDLEPFWEQTPLMVREEAPDLTAVYLAVDFLIRDYADAVDPLAVLLARQEQLAFGSYGTWLLNWVGDADGTVNNPLSAAYLLDADWQEATVSDPTPLPAGSLTLSCQQQSGQRETAAFRLDLASGEWRQLTEPTSAFFFISSLPDHRSLFIQRFPEGEPNPDAIQLSLWRDGERHYAWRADQLAVTFSEASPDSRYAVGFSLSGDGPPAPSLIDLEACDDESCSFSALSGIPRWSPDSSRTLLNAPETFFGNNFVLPDRAFLFNNGGLQVDVPLRIGDAQGNPLPPFEESLSGSSVTWLDNEHVGVVMAFSGVAGQALLEVSAETGETAVLTTTTSLADVLQLAQADGAALSLRFVQPNSANRDELLLGLFEEPSNLLHLVLFDRQNGDAIVLRSGRPANVSVSSLSPNGRFLLTTMRGEAFNFAEQLELVNRETGETAVFPIDISDTFIIDYLFDWQPDGEWVAASLAPNVLLLFHPATNQTKLFRHDHGACYQVAWQLP